MIALCLLLFATPVDLSLKREVEVSGSEVRLVDLVTSESYARLIKAGIGNLGFGDVPSFPRAKVIARAAIASKLERENRNLDFSWSGPAAVLVKAASEEFSAIDLETAIRDWLALNQPQEGTLFIERLSIPNPGALPAGAVNFVVRARANDDLVGVGALYVDIEVDGKLYRTLSVSYQTSVELLVAKLNHDMERGQSIGEQDLTWGYQRMNRIASPLIRPGVTIQMRAKSMLRAGSVLDQRSVEAIPLVERNQEVAVLASKGRLTIRLMGLSLDNGALGDKIRIKNRDSGELITAEVSAMGEARISL